MTSFGYIIVDSCIISLNLNCIVQLKQLYDIATKVSSRKKCYYFWWSTWLIKLAIRVSTPVFIQHIGDPCHHRETLNALLSFVTDGFLLRASNAELWWNSTEPAVKQTVVLPVIGDALALTWRHWNIYTEISALHIGESRMIPIHHNGSQHVLFSFHYSQTY